MTKSETRRERARQNKKERDTIINNGRQRKKEQGETEKKRDKINEPRNNDTKPERNTHIKNWAITKENGATRERTARHDK